MYLTYGAELEIADCDTRTVLPEGNTWDMRDWTVVNSDGVWNDPKKLFTPYGGEINTKVTNSRLRALENIARIEDTLKEHGGYTINHSCNLHIHIGIPAWNLATVKCLVDYVWRNQRAIFALTPLPNDLKLKRRKVSNQHMIPTYIRNRIMAAKPGDDVAGMFGNTRFGINIKSLYTHGTVEFRQFGMTFDANKMQDAFWLCARIVRDALSGLQKAGNFNYYHLSYTMKEYPTHVPQTMPDLRNTHLGKHTRMWVLRHRKSCLKLAFVCHGNVNRSKAAEIIFKHLDSEGLFNVESFGMREGTYNKPMHSQTAHQLKAHGYKWCYGIDTGHKDLVTVYPVSRKLPEDYDGLVIDLRDKIPDPGYTKDGHYSAFIATEAYCKILYKELTDEEPQQQKLLR
jgi:hypothetical protein